MQFFTPEEASRTLPLVKRIVRDILRVGQEIRSRGELLAGEIRDDSQMKQLLKELHQLFGEIEVIGGSYKDWSFTQGLVDFPAIIEGEEVLLCWRSDEDDLRYYHKLEDGYGGRKPIPEHYFPG